MTGYVVLVSVGPVQGFISAARRSRDLWAGSYLLSELAKACALELQQAGAKLVFPHASGAEDLKANSVLMVGNKIQAVFEVQSPDQLRHFVDSAKQATQARFEQLVREVKGKLGAGIRDEIWSLQLGDYIEMQAAWALIEGTDYIAASKGAAGALAARKATRDFAASQLTAEDSKFMLPKSSLDGLRETVLNENSGSRRALRLADSEQLDTAGVVKRLGAGGNLEQFTPFSRLAADAWIKLLTPDELKSLIEAYEPLVKADLATRVSGNSGCYADFPYDAQLCYRSRLQVAQAQFVRTSESTEGSSPTEGESASLKNLQRLLETLWRQHGEPCPYSVLILADGDRMGQLLSAATSIEDHQRISAALAEFASKVGKCLRDHSGHAIYAGGDDVLGMLPLGSALDCAYELSVLFQECLKDSAKQLDQSVPTLSVGLAIAHMMTPFGAIRELAHRSEKIAKGTDDYPLQEQRHALSLLLKIRGGSEYPLRIRFDDQDAKQAFKAMVEAYSTENQVAKALPSRVAFDVRRISESTKFALEGKQKDLGAELQATELRHMLKKSQTTAGTPIDAELIDLLVKRSEQGLENLANQLIVARWLAAKTSTDLIHEGDSA